MIPVKVEFGGHLGHHRPDDRHVEIDKIRLLMSPKIFVADIATAHNGDLPVGNKGLVVHPLVDASEVGDHASPLLSLHRRRRRDRSALRLASPPMAFIRRAQR